MAGRRNTTSVEPDLCTLGKVIGGGFPLAAIAGRAEIMAHFDKGKVGDDGFLMQIGTLSGNPVAAAAGSRDAGDPEAAGGLRANLRHRPRADADPRRTLEAGRHPGAGDRRAAAVRGRVHRRPEPDPRLCRHIARRHGHRAAVQCAAARARHPEGRAEILRVSWRTPPTTSATPARPGPRRSRRWRTRPAAAAQAAMRGAALGRGRHR